MSATITPLSPATVNCPARAINNEVITPNGKYLYACGYYYNNAISIFSRDLVTGLLTLVSTQAGPATNIYWIAMHPSGDYLYAIDPGGSGSGYVYSYSIDPATGLLTLIQTLAVTAGQSQTRIVVHPSGTCAFIASDNFPDQSIFSYTIASGMLTHTNTIATSTNFYDLWALGFDRTGTWLYATNSTNHTVLQYSINLSTAALTLVNTVACSLATDIADIGFTPDNLYCYISGYSNNLINQYSVDQVTGFLTPLSPATITPPGANPYQIQFAQGGVFVNCLTTPYSVTCFQPVAGQLTNAVDTGAPNGLAFVVSSDGLYAYTGITVTGGASADIAQGLISASFNTYTVTYTGLTNEQAPIINNPRVSLEISNDGGQTFSPPIFASTGNIGQYLTRARWQRLGSARDRVFRVSCSDPVKFDLLSCFIDFENGQS